MMIRNNTNKINKSINIKEGANDGAHNSAIFIHDTVKILPIKPLSSPVIDKAIEEKSHILAGAMVGIAFVSMVIQIATFLRSGKTVSNIITRERQQ